MTTSAQLLKSVFISAVFVLFFSVFAVRVSALDPTGQACQGEAAKSSLCNPTSNDDLVGGPENVFVKIARIIVWITGIASVLMIIIGGFAYVTSSGDPQRLKGAKDSILYAVIGLVIALSAQMIISFVLDNVG